MHEIFILKTSRRFYIIMPKDVQILRGFSNLTNLDNVKPGMNIEDIENQLINGGLVERTKDPQDKFNDELRDLANQFGISFGDTQKQPSGTSLGPSLGPSLKQSPSAPAMRNDFSTNRDHTSDSACFSKREFSTDRNFRPQSSPVSAYTDVGSDDIDDDNADDDITDDTQQITSESFARSELGTITKEQERRSHINSVMRDISPSSSFNFEDEKREDLKCQMLEEIDSLIYALQDAEVDLSRIPKVGLDNSYDEIEKVLKILRHKSDRSRYCSLAEEFLIWGAYGMEELFDGKRVWLGKYQPCLTGWNVQVQTKLRRMRCDTSQLVSEVMHDYNIGPGLRVLLELIPNMFVFSSEKKKNMTRSGSNLYSDADMAAANERLRALN